MDDKAKCGCEAEMLKRLAQRFTISEFGSTESRGLSANTVAGIIGGDVEECDVDLMFDLGFFGEVRRGEYSLERVSAAAVLRFMESDLFEEWARTRREKVLARLRWLAERQEQLVLKAVGASVDALEEIAERAAEIEA